MNITRIDLGAEFGTDLSSRRSASELRSQVTVALSGAAEQIEFDLSHVRTISHSFADELFAILVLEHGADWFRDHVHVINPSGAVRQTILEAILQRLETHGIPV